MSKWWKVFVTEPDGHRKMLRFELVADAVKTAREWKADGFTVEVVSASKGYAPTRKAGPRPSAKHYWCPYCIKWRVFQLIAVKRKGLRGPEDLRCPICLISDHDFHVRRFNGLLGEIDLEAMYRMEGAVKF